MDFRKLIKSIVLNAFIPVVLVAVAVVIHSLDPDYIIEVIATITAFISTIRHYIKIYKAVADYIELEDLA